MLYLKDIKEQERRNGDKLTFLQKKMKKLKRKNYQDNDFIKWIKQKYNNKDSGLFTHLYCQILLKIYLCGVNALVLIYCARLVRRKRALIEQIKKSPQKYTEILLKADTQLPDEEMERFLHEAEEARKSVELEKKEIKNKKSTCTIIRDTIFEIFNKIFLFTGIYLLACKIFNRDLTSIEIILAKCSYAEFAFLVLLYPMCIEKKSEEKGTYAINLTVGMIALFLELGLILFSLH